MQITININIDERIIKFIKKPFATKTNRLRLFTALLICATIMVNAASITKPYTFEAGQDAMAEEVNANFDALFTKVNELDTSMSSVNSLAKATLSCSTDEIVKYNGTDWVCATESAPLIRDVSRNLRIQNNSSNLDTQMDISADEIILQDDANQAMRVTNVNVTVDMTVAGANGRDAGVENIDTWYYIWVISNGSTTAGLLSESNTAPTMPSGYSYKALVGSVYNDTSGNLIPVNQVGKNQYIRTIARATGLGPRDDIDSGQIVSRVLSITKKYANTSIRLSYTDNFMALNYACRWEIKVDGNSCPGGSLYYDFFQQYNIYRSGTFIGYCDGLSSGLHEIQVWVSPHPSHPSSNCHTGWDSSRWVIEAEEVY